MRLLKYLDKIFRKATIFVVCTPLVWEIIVSEIRLRVRVRVLSCVLYLYIQYTGYCCHELLL